MKTIRPLTAGASGSRAAGNRSVLAFISVLLALGLTGAQGVGQGVTLANPHWNITLSDFGYSDYLLDNTPGFEGREYLSGEWGAAVGYGPAGGPVATPRFLEPQFLFPDWPTLSTFGVASPAVLSGVNADGLPIAQSVVTNAHLEITLRHEMVDTVVGTPMGVTRASASGTGAALSSSRYVLKQTAILRNISGGPLTNVQFFQFLHGLQSQRGVYDDRAYVGPLGEFRYDVTQAGVDAAAVGAGSSTAGLEDYIALHAKVVPSAFEVGYYGIEGNGVDDHARGKPSEGVHLSIENNWRTLPYSVRQGTDEFVPTNRWVSGAQRWDLGNLAAGGVVSVDVLLSIRSGTRVTTGDIVSGGCNGGSSVPGGLDYEFESVSREGSCFGEYSKADAAEMVVRVDEGEFGPLTFLTPGGPVQLWKVQFTGEFVGNVKLDFGYDPTALPPGFDEATLSLYEFTGGSWQTMPGAVDPVRHTVSVSASQLGTFALGVEALITYQVEAVEAPSNSGTIIGAGPYADGSSATLVASPNAGYVFRDWTENGAVISTSPSLTFLVRADRALVAGFVAVGAARSVTTQAQPAEGGATGGDGAYAPGSSATVTATANPGYKFSKWLTNGVTASTAGAYTFTVTGDAVLVAKFKPVYSVQVSADPPEGGEVEADPAYEPGELAKLKAKPADGWAFVNWTQNGVEVSTDPNFQFNVTGNRILVGHFARGYRIEASAEPANGGSATGGGVHGAGEIVDLLAVANPGYVFVGWTEAGVPVSDAADYSFTATAGRILVANFVAQPALLTGQSAVGVMTLSWPASAQGWRLQENAGLEPDGWRDSDRPVTVVDGRNQVTIPATTASAFFRLMRP